MNFAPSHRCGGLVAHALACTRGGEAIFSRLDLSLAAGQALLVRGANGVGKSSLLMILAGLLPAASGTITWTDTDPETPASERLHYLGHRAGVRAGLSVGENLAFWSAVQGGDPQAQTAALETAGLATLVHLDAAVLSAGQTKRLALARLMASPRPVWLLDEPTSALDSQGAAWVGERISAHLDSGGLAIIATHLPLGIEADPRVFALEMGAFRP